jgi:hypothetical protein
MPWTSSGDGDGPVAGHGVELARRFFRHMWLSDPTVQCVVVGALNELAASHDTASEIDVATGAALVYGTFLWNDAAVTLTLAGVGADTAGIVVAGMDWTGGVTGTAQTGYIRAVQAAGGSTTFPTPDQSDLTNWEVEIARYIVDSSGDVFTDVGKGTPGPRDTRIFVGHRASGGLVKLAEFAGDGSSDCVFSDIPQVFTHLRIVGLVHSTYAADSSADILDMRFNNDSGTNYRYRRVENDGTISNANADGATSFAEFGWARGEDGATDVADSFTIDIPNYADDTLEKTMQVMASGSDDLGVYVLFNTVGWWQNTAAITRVDILARAAAFKAGTKITLYGLH